MKKQEAAEQIALIMWSMYEVGKYPELNLLFHIPNGGSRNKLEAYNLKKQGVKPGVPDLCLPVARGGYHGLFIEMKAGKNTTSTNQDEWIRNLKEQGYCAAVCYGFEQAKDLIIEYLNLKG